MRSSSRADLEPTRGAEDFCGEPVTCRQRPIRNGPSADADDTRSDACSDRSSQSSKTWGHHMTRLNMTRLNMTKLSRLLYVCVGAMWAGVSLIWVGTGLAYWDGAETASAAVFSAVGGIVATTFTAAVGWFAWKRRNLRPLARVPGLAAGFWQGP